jgi:hypothetical protein
MFFPVSLRLIVGNVVADVHNVAIKIIPPQ